MLVHKIINIVLIWVILNTIFTIISSNKLSYFANIVTIGY